jgi:exodeoxyribonuclease VII small subunit
MTEKPVADMTFEEAMAELEAVVARLEQGDVPLEDSIALYERGAALKAHCDARLKAAEEKVEQIRLGETGTPEGTRPFSAG